MKRIWHIVGIVSIYLLLVSPVLASVITYATYHGTLRISNNSTSTTNVFVPFTLSSATFISGGFANATLNDIAVLIGGSDTAIMPGLGANPWMVYAPNAPQGSIDYDFYSGNATGGKVSYFPDTTGMLTIDDTTLELGDNFTVEQNGLWDMSAVGTVSWNKTDAFQISISSTSNISAVIHPVLTWTDPTSGNGTWDNISNSYDNDAATYAMSDNVTSGNWTTYLELDVPDATYSGISFNATDSNGAGQSMTNASIGIYTGSQWIQVWQGTFTEGTVKEADFAALWATKIRIRGYNSVGGTENIRIHEIDVGQGCIVTASGVSSGEYTVRLTADTQKLYIYIDDVEEDWEFLPP